MDTDKVMADGSINKLSPYETQGASALLDAATLAGSWIVVDQLMDRGRPRRSYFSSWLSNAARNGLPSKHRPLERLGSAREGTRSGT